MSMLDDRSTGDEVVSKGSKSRRLKLRKRVLWLLAVCCAMAIAAISFPKGKDDYAPLRALHPREEFADTEPGSAAESEHIFYFSQAEPEVSSVVFSLARDGHMWAHDGIAFTMRNGEDVYYQQSTSYPLDGSTCRLIVYGARPSWVERTWITIKQRLGL